MRATREWLKQLSIEANKEKLETVQNTYLEYHKDEKIDGPVETVPMAPVAAMTEPLPSVKTCPVHGVEMQLRDGSRGKFYSHLIGGVLDSAPDKDKWCNHSA